jgi:hypothetical protein
VPAIGLAAVVLNVTVTGPTKSSFLTAWPTGATRPTASDLNWVGDQTVPNLGVVKLGSNGVIQVFNAAGSIDVIVDVSGWYSSQSSREGDDQLLHGEGRALVSCRSIMTLTRTPACSAIVASVRWGSGVVKSF